MPPDSDQDKRQQPHGTARPEPVETAPATVEFALAADWVSPSVARDRVRSWLRAHRWSPSHTDDLVLAINEAVSNSIEHGYGLVPLDGAQPARTDGAVVEVRGRLVTDPDGSRRVEFTVRDQGRWLAPSTGATSRGHGVRLMRACVDNVTIDHGRHGTTVVLHSRPMPPPLRSV
ncbi:ATP-binding protein [Actinophytocola sp.]|uniref:ATP-binding protein n=1 Tax=Actinophytocola sp. TaxID=1872138 RepID=UPI002ED897FB